MVISVEVICSSMTSMIEKPGKLAKHHSLEMKHPFQILVTDKLGEHLFVSVKNKLLVFRLSDGVLVGTWTDTVDTQTFQEQKFKARHEAQKLKQEQEPASKKAKTNKKEPKVPVPGPGAPVIYNYIRSLTLTRDEHHIIGTTDSDKAAVIFLIDYSKENCLALVKRQTFPKRPCAVSTSINDADLIVADKFGDVYSIPINDERIIDEKALVPILGHVSMLSDVFVAEHDNKQYVLTGDRDEHIKITHFPKSYVVKQWLFGHREFVSCLHLSDFNKDILVSGGGDDYLMLWDWFNAKKLAKVELRELIQPFLKEDHYPPERFRNEDSPKEISITKVQTLTHNGAHLIIVLCENTNCLLTFEVKGDFSVVHKQTFTTDKPLVDFAIVKDSIFAAVDCEDGELIEIYTLNDDLLLEKKDDELAKKISQASDCEVESRNDFYPLYYISSLRKRSEH